MIFSPFRVIPIAVTLIISVANVGAQPASPKVLDFNKHFWVNYSGDHNIRGRWGVHFDAQWRRSDFGSIWQQYMARPAINYQLSKDVLLSAGYAYAHTYPYGDYPATHAFPEHRAYQQLQITKRVRGLSLQQRSRLEQRWIRYANQREWTYQNRFRHQVRVEVPIGSPDNPKRWYVPVYDEILLGIPPNYGARPFDQNRFAAGLGKAHGPMKVEAVYMNQFTGQRNGRVFEFNNTLVLSITSSAKLSSLWD
jgi:hypothetical protein